MTYSLLLNSFISFAKILTLFATTEKAVQLFTSQPSCLKKNPTEAGRASQTTITQSYYLNTFNLYTYNNANKSSFHVYFRLIELILHNILFNSHRRLIVGFCWRAPSLALSFHLPNVFCSRLH